MQCDPELVSAFLDGTLDYFALDTVTDHLRTCHDCCLVLSWLVQIRDGAADDLMWRDSGNPPPPVVMTIKNEHVFQELRYPSW